MFLNNGRVLTWLAGWLAHNVFFFFFFFSLMMRDCLLSYDLYFSNAHALFQRFLYSCRFYSFFQVSVSVTRNPSGGRRRPFSTTPYFPSSFRRCCCHGVWPLLFFCVCVPRLVFPKPRLPDFSLRFTNQYRFVVVVCTLYLSPIVLVQLLLL